MEKSRERLRRLLEELPRYERRAGYHLIVDLSEEELLVQQSMGVLVGNDLPREKVRELAEWIAIEIDFGFDVTPRPWTH